MHSTFFACERKRDMVLHLLLLVLLWFPSSAAEVFVTNHPGCQRSCGDVTIYYPFGIGDDPRCFRNEWFQLRCVLNDTKLLLKDTIAEVMNISVLTGQIGIRSSIGVQCNSGNSTIRPPVNSTVAYINLGNGPYTLSSTGNKFTVIGCNFFGIMEGRKPDGRHYMTACLAYCKDSAVSGSAEEVCDGWGCCQLPISEGLKVIEGFTRPYDGNTEPKYSCKYHFLVDQKQFTFSASDLHGDNFYERSKNMQVVVDWAVGNETCEEAQNNTATTYACRSHNSYCYNSANRLGYLCNCSLGYQGNPYVDGGCQGIYAVNYCCSLSCLAMVVTTTSTWV